MSRIIRLALVAFVGLGSAAATGTPKQQPCGIAIVGGTLIDGNGANPVEDFVVLINGNRIASVGPKAKLTVPACAQTIDATGKTVLPGLINSNTHLSLTASSFFNPPGGDTGNATEADAIKKLPHAEENISRSLKILLMQGVTSVRDTNGFGKPLLAVKRENDRPGFAGSRLFLGTLSICSPEQYERITRNVGPFGPALKDRFRPVYKVPDDLKPIEVPEISFWKITLSGGDWGTRNAISDALLKAIVDEGHRAGKMVDAHVFGNIGIRSGLDAGLDIMEHPNLGRPIPMSLIEEFASKGVFLSPLHMVVEGFVEIFDNPYILNDPIYQKVLQPEEYEKVQTIKERMIQARRHPDWRFEDIDSSLRNMSLDEWHTALEFCRENLRNYIKAKTRIIMSTDAGGTQFNFPEMAWHVRELKMYVRFGMTPLEALQTATKNAGEALKMGKDLGTIDVGKLADVIVVNGNPLMDMDALYHVDVVIKDGVRYK
jgi:imidazolonepropionase-like amidohydrolase